MAPINTSEDAHVESMADTTLNDMLSFKLGQEVTVNRIIIDDSDEDIANDCPEIKSPRKYGNVSATFSNVIILGTKKPNAKKVAVENDCIKEKNNDLVIKTELNEEEKIIHSAINEITKQNVGDVEINRKSKEDIQNELSKPIKIENTDNGVQKIMKSKVNENNKSNKYVPEKTILSNSGEEKNITKLLTNQVVSINMENIRDIQNANDYNDTEIIEPSNLKKINPNETEPIEVENTIHLPCLEPNIDPIIIQNNETSTNNKSVTALESTTDDQPSDAKKCKRDYPRTKVTSRREIKKYPGKINAMRRQSDDLSQFETTPRAAKNNNVNVYDPYILPTLTTVAENILIIFPTLHAYLNATKTLTKTDEAYKRIKSEFEIIKHHCFCLSYSTTVTTILPNKENVSFLDNFCGLAEKLAAKKGTLHFTLDNFQILFREMIAWTEYKQKKMAIYHTNSIVREEYTANTKEVDPKNKDPNSHLKKILQTPSIPITRAPAAATSDNKLCMLVASNQSKARRPGQQIETTTYNGAQSSPTPICNMTINPRYQTSNSNPVYKPNDLRPNNILSQPTSLSKSNNEPQVEPTTKTVESNFSIQPTAFNYDILNAVPTTNQQNSQSNHTTSDVTTNCLNPMNSKSFNFLTINNNPINQTANSNSIATSNTFNPNVVVHQTSTRNYPTGHSNQVMTSNALQPNHTIMDTSKRNHSLYMDAYIESLQKKQAPDDLSNAKKPRKYTKSRPTSKPKASAAATAQYDMTPANYTNTTFNQFQSVMCNQQSTYVPQPPSYSVYQNQQNIKNYQMSQRYYEQKMTAQIQYSSSAMHPEVPVNVHLQERSSVSRDSGYRSPMNEANLFIDQQDAMVNVAASSNESNFAQFQQFQQMASHPVITHVTSLDPNVRHSPYANCNVCNNMTNLRCIRCNTSYYCSYECQLSDWPTHVTKCKQQ